jgi:hypothetical protein
METAERQPSRTVRIGSLWYIGVPVLTLGLLTFVPFLHAAIRLRRVWVWLATILFMLVAGGAFYVSGQPEGTTSGAVDALVVIAVLGSMTGGATLLAKLRHEVYGLGRPALPAPSADRATTDDVDPAVRRVLQAREKRARARALVTADPLMGRELHIGRPDLEGGYDDGGLVDIASAPGNVIAGVLDLSPEQAAAIVAVRDTAITVEDLFSMTDLPVSTWDRVRDRAVIVR